MTLYFSAQSSSLIYARQRNCGTVRVPVIVLIYPRGPPRQNDCCLRIHPYNDRYDPAFLFLCLSGAPKLCKYKHGMIEQAANTIPCSLDFSLAWALHVPWMVQGQSTEACDHGRNRCYWSTPTMFRSYSACASWDPPPYRPPADEPGSSPPEPGLKDMRPTMPPVHYLPKLGWA